MLVSVIAPMQFGPCYIRPYADCAALISAAANQFEPPNLMLQDLGVASVKFEPLIAVSDGRSRLP